MKSNNNIDKEIQKILFEKENREIVPDLFNSDDVELYKKISSGLSDEPIFSLDANFAENVTKIAIRRKSAQIALKVILTYSLIGVALILVGGTAFYFLAKDTLDDLLRLVLDYNLQIIFTVLLVLVIQLVDKIFIQKRSNINLSE